MSLPIVLISGWGMPATVLEPLACSLDRKGRVSVVQLPGLVEEPEATYDWQALLDYLDLHLLETPVVLVGWSLGGVLASLYASRYPEKVSGVINLATNPCFVRRDDWLEAMLPQTFQSFQQGLQKDVQATFQQFAMLCSMGNQQRKPLLKTFLHTLQNDVDVEKNALEQLLIRLGESDIRSSLNDLRCPVVHFFAKDDVLVPVSVVRSVEQLYPNHTVSVVEGGHSFFLDEPSPAAQQIVAHVTRLCQRGQE